MISGAAGMSNELVKNRKKEVEKIKRLNNINLITLFMKSQDYILNEEESFLEYFVFQKNKKYIAVTIGLKYMRFPNGSKISMKNFNYLKYGVTEKINIIDVLSKFGDHVISYHILYKFKNSFIYDVDKKFNTKLFANNFIKDLNLHNKIDAIHTQLRTSTSDEKIEEIYFYKDKKCILMIEFHNLLGMIKDIDHSIFNEENFRIFHKYIIDYVKEMQLKFS